MNDKLKLRKWGGLLALSFLSITLFFCNCNERMDTFNVPEGTPPDLSKPSEITSYFPDSGGVGTQLIIEGTNFGSDTSYIKVTVNGKNARVVGSNGKVIYAIVPSRADTGLVKVYIGKDTDKKEYAFNNEFKYIFKQNVSTVAGTDEGITDGPVTEAKLRKPMWVTFDKDGAMYIVEHGEGDQGQGGIRRIYNGNVETLMRTQSGLFQRPRALAFGVAKPGMDPNQDTLYVANDRNDRDDPNINMAVGIMSRQNDFKTIKTLEYHRQNNHVCVNPVTNEVFYNNYSDGLLFKWNKKTQQRELMYDVDGGGVEFSTVFSKDGKTLFLILRNRQCIYKGDYNLTTGELTNVEHFVGTWNSTGYINGQGTVTKFDQPCQGDTDEEGNLYVADKYNHCIRMITPEGVVSTWAGQGRDKSGYQDGDPLKAQFREPEGACFGPDGALYVGDFNNHKIRKILIE
ncbi:MAG: IPT/TIG domain-containing protein [Dysgonomonas sp.]|nr:IPT/TIG domain-containing protein [Dysgonomonas sp.]